jgi:molecular chaperone HtpG
MTTAQAAPQTRPFEADVAKLLHLMVHSIYSDRDIFLRELISNAADACEKLRYEGLADPGLLGDGQPPRITLTLDSDSRRLIVEDNGIGMTEAELAEALGTIARSGTKAFMERVAAAKDAEGSQLIGQFGVGFYSPSWSPTESTWSRVGRARRRPPSGPLTARAPIPSSRSMWRRRRRAARA